MQNGSGREVVIVEAVRTPIGRGHPEKGYYKDTHPNELLGRCYTEVISRAGVEADQVEDVITGCVQQYGEQMFNVGRNAWLQAGLPEETPATTVDRQCSTARRGGRRWHPFVRAPWHCRECRTDKPLDLRAVHVAHDHEQHARGHELLRRY